MQIIWCYIILFGHYKHLIHGWTKHSMQVMHQAKKRFRSVDFSKSPGGYLCGDRYGYDMVCNQYIMYEMVYDMVMYIYICMYILCMPHPICCAIGYVYIYIYIHNRIH